MEDAQAPRHPRGQVGAGVNHNRPRFRCTLDGRPVDVDVAASYEHTLELIQRVSERPTRFTLLKALADSPWAYLTGAAAALDQPDDESFAAKLGAGPGRDNLTARRLGSATHHMILGSPERVVVYDRAAADANPEPKRRRRAGAAEEQPKGVVRQGAAWEAFSAEHDALGNVILLEREYREVRAMADMLLRSEEACRLLFDGTILEQQIKWSYNGTAISSRPDARVPGNRVVDLKSCVDSAPLRFGPLIYKNHYHTQLYCYDRAAEHEDQAAPEEAWIVAIDRKRPPRCYRIPAEGLELGAKVLTAWLEELGTCLASQHFPFESRHVAHPPEWLLDGLDFDLPPGDDA